MLSNDKSFAKKVLRTLLIALGAILLIHLTLQFLNIVVYGQHNSQIFELSNRFDLDDESSLPTWFSQLLYLIIALAAATAAWLEKKSKSRFVWLTIAIVSLIFSIDEIATFHEHVLWTLHSTFLGNTHSTPLKNGWTIAMPFILLVAGGLIYFIYKHLPKRTFKFFVLGGVIFLAGAMGVDIVTSSMSFSDFQSQGLLVALEEGMEFLGCITVLYAIIDFLESSYKTRFVAALKKLK